jgi:hypothetical protein
VLVGRCKVNGRKFNCVGVWMYNEWTEIDFLLFVVVQSMEGNSVVYVWSCSGSGMKLNCVGLEMYRE